MSQEPLWLDEARAEVLAAARWYAEQAPEVLLRFFDAVDHAQNVVAATPRAWQAGAHGTRRCVLRRFPFLLV